MYSFIVGPYEGTAWDVSAVLFIALYLWLHNVHLAFQKPTCLCFLLILIISGNEGSLCASYHCFNSSSTMKSRFWTCIQGACDDNGSSHVGGSGGTMTDGRQGFYWGACVAWVSIRTTRRLFLYDLSALAVLVMVLIMVLAMVTGSVGGSAILLLVKAAGGNTLEMLADAQFGGCSTLCAWRRSGGGGGGGGCSIHWPRALEI